MSQEKIAQLAGVSRATVSKALSGSAEVARATRERIVQLARDLAYEPHGAARTLASGKTGLVGLVPLATDQLRIGTWEAAVIEGFYQAFASTGMDLVLLREESRQGLPKLVAQRAVDGVVIVSFPHDELTRWINRNKTPCVGVNLGDPQGTEGIDTVEPDSTGGVRQAIEHLASLGHRRVGYVNTWLDPSHAHRPTVAKRLRAFLATMAEMDLRASPGSDTYCEVSDRVTALMDSSDPPTALVCYSDGVAMLAMQALHERGIRVPEDISVIGIDDVWSAMMACPPLTSVHVPFVEMGRRAGELLLARVAEPERPVERVVIPERLVVRKSTGPVHA